MARDRTTYRHVLWQTVFTLAALSAIGAAMPPPASAAESKPAAQIRIDPGHPWRPPFGLDRVGRPLAVEVEIAADRQPRP